MTAEFTINKTTYTFHEITIGAYYELRDTLAQNTQEAKFKIVEILTKCPASELRKLKHIDWLIIFEEAGLRINALAGDTTNIKPIIEFEGKRYGFPTPETMSIGEFADLEILFTAPDFQSRLHEAAAILYRPILKQRGEKINIEDYDSDKAAERAQEFLRLPISAIRSANSFFLHYAQQSLSNILQSLMEREEMKQMDPSVLEHLQSLLQQEYGGISSIPFLEKTLSNLQKQQQLNYALRLTGYPGEQPKSKTWSERLREKAEEIKARKEANKK